MNEPNNIKKYNQRNESNSIKITTKQMNQII